MIDLSKQQHFVVGRNNIEVKKTMAKKLFVNYSMDLDGWVGVN